jgi:hypothetical protein
MKKDINQQFVEAVITALHPECETYDEAIKKEKDNIGTEVKYTFDDYNEIKKQKITPYITIGRVMQALIKKMTGIKNADKLNCDPTGFFIQGIIKEIENWKLIKKNGQEATSEDQNEETLTKLLELIKND